MSQKTTNNFLLVTEISTIFIFLPLIFVFGLLPNYMMMATLFGVFLYCVFIMAKYKIKIFEFDLQTNMLTPLLIRFVFVSLVISIFTYLYKPQNLFYFVKNNPLMWLMVMIFYPIFSAFTQEVIFRRFFFFRYQNLWKNENLTLVFSTLAFAYMHTVFKNQIAVIFTLVGGLIFSYMYKKTKSIMLVSIEHALYGDVLFTLGLGYYFYHGSVWD